MTILDEIIAYKKQEVAAARVNRTVKELEKSRHFNRTALSLSEFLLDPGRSGIIAEFKRKSPSKGIINNQASVEDVTAAYFAAGASGLSVLTDAEFFGGSSLDLEAARRINECPILRKDFTISKYQVIEARAMGADAILLIAAVLSKEEIRDLSKLARATGLEVLLEVHNEEELDKICDSVDIVGVNNRNLKDFSVDIETSAILSEKIPGNFIMISESGIDRPETVRYLKSFGFQGFLMGEHFMKSNDPGRACREFINKCKEN